MVGKPQKDSFAAKVRQAVQELSAKGVECSTTNVSVQLRIKTTKDHNKMLNALCDMCQVGKLVRVRVGVYALPPPIKPVPVGWAPPTSPEKEQKQQVMWRVLRMRKSLVLNDLVSMAMVSRDYAAQWLRGLLRNGVVRQDGELYRLLVDTVTMPEMTDNADRLRALRERKKGEVLSMVEVAQQALSSVMVAMADF